MAPIDSGRGGVAPVSGDVLPDGVRVPDGFTVTAVVDGLSQPTQLDVLDDGRFLVAELHGSENEGTGRVLLLDPARPDDAPAVVVDGLLKPTGVVGLGPELWVMQQRSLSRGPLTGGPLTVVLDDLPFNGRSEGSLSVDGEGRVMYETSGTLDGSVAAAGSATLWAVDPGGSPVPVATGLKNAYGRTLGADGTLWQTEIADGTYDGAPAPDELVRVEAGDDFGWPRCVGDRTPVAQYGGTADSCVGSPRSHALFEPGATPTSVAVAPWDDGVLLVALWNAGQVVAVPVDGTEPVAPEPFLAGVDHPQDLVADGDRLLVVDFSGGRILAVTVA
ncbi:MAG: PQQ-dependent sugar dehydrogenase [Ilumatobacteraceae bacterium]